MCKIAKASTKKRNRKKEENTADVLAYMESRRGECVRISKLDAQREIGKAIFGGGLLLSSQKAAERAAAHKWELSERELAIVAGLE